MLLLKTSVFVPNNVKGINIDLDQVVFINVSVVEILTLTTNVA